MGVPVPVDVVAFDPVLEAGTKSTLFACPEVSLTAPGGAPRVVVMTVDQVGRPELDVLRTVRDTPARPDVVLVAAELAPDGALHAIAAGARGLLRRREADVTRLSRAVLAASAATARCRRTSWTGCWSAPAPAAGRAATPPGARTRGRRPA